MNPFFLAIEGPIGVGKTTLARLLQPRFEAELLLEAFEENPFLSDFYSDRARYAFQTQMFFLLSRYRQQKAIPSLTASQPLVADYMFAKDALFARLNLGGDELDMYRRLYEVLAERIASPDLVIYLQADTNVLMARIAARDRPYEREMDRDYIDAVKATYQQYFGTYDTAPLVSIDTNDLNYVQDPSALAFVEGKARQALGIGAYQQSLPQIEPGGRAKQKAALVEMGRHSPDEETGQRVGGRALGEYLAANEAVGRVGALLARAQGDRNSKEQVSELKVTLGQAMDRLRELADAVGVDLPSTGRKQRREAAPSQGQGTRGASFARETRDIETGQDAIKP